MKTVDAKGLSCPEPVIMLRQALNDKADEYIVIVDNAVSRENCTRYAEHVGYAVSVSKEIGVYTLHLTKG